MTILQGILLLLITAYCQDLSLHDFPHFQSQPPSQQLQDKKLQSSEESSNADYPKIISIKISNSTVYPEEYPGQHSRCFGNDFLKIKQEQNLIVTANQPFVLFFYTKTTSRYYNEEYGGKEKDSILINRMIESNMDQNHMHKVIVPLNLKCTYIMTPYLRMVGNLRIDFYKKTAHDEYQFKFMLICASKQTNDDFMKIYRPGYIFFWVIVNLALQIYHAYPRNNNHLTLFLIFFLSSLLIDDQLVGYILSISIFMVVLLMEKKNRTVNGKVFSLYLTFFVLSVTLIMFAYSAETDGSDWNILWIIIQNCVQLHVVMFLTLRLIKLSRFRYVFWYFISVSIFSFVYQGNNNIFFNLNFKNPLDLNCVSAELFFPIMMLPISNYFTSITNWMHRVMAGALSICAILPLNWAIILMIIVIVSIEAYQIKTKSLEIIKHTY